MLGHSSGGGVLWNRRVSQVQGRGAGRAMDSLPLFRSSAHLAQIAGLQGAGRRTGFGKAAAEQRGPLGHLKGGALALGGHLRYFSKPKGSKPASDALDEPCSSSLRDLAKLPTPASLQGVHEPSSSLLRTNLANPAETAVRLQGVHEPSSSSLRVHLAKPAEPVVTLQCPGRRMGFGKVRGSPGHLKGAALGGLLTCYASGSEPPPSSFLDDPSASLQDKLDRLHEKLDLFLRKLDDMMSIETSIKRLLWWIFAGIVLVISVVIAVGILYNVAGGRGYVEAELNRVIKTVFLNFANDSEVSAKLDELVIRRVDTTLAYISSIQPWYKLFFGK